MGHRRADCSCTACQDHRPVPFCGMERSRLQAWARGRRRRRDGDRRAGSRRAGRCATAASTSRSSSGTYPYENVWGLLVDDDLRPRTCRPPSRTSRPALTGNAPADLQAETARARRRAGGSSKLTEIPDDEQAREDLGRLSAQVMSIVARSARVADGRRIPPPTTSSRQARPAAERFLLALARRGRSAAREGDRHLLDLHGRARPQRVDVHRPRRRLRPARTAAAALSAAVGALSGPLHGGAPAYVLPMLDEVARIGDAEALGRDALDAGERHHGLRPPRLPGRGSACRGFSSGRRRSSASPRVEVAEELEQVALAGAAGAPPRARRSRRTSSTSRRSCSTSPTSPRRSRRAMFACSRVAGWSAHILEQKRTGRLVRPSGALRRAGPAAGVVRGSSCGSGRWPAAAAEANALARER